MKNVFCAHANAVRKECNPDCSMQGIGDKEQYYRENIEKLYTHKMPHAFTGFVDPECCTNRFEADGSQSTATFSQYVKIHSNLAPFNRVHLITPSTSSTPSTIHTRKSKNVSLPSTTSATKNAPTSVTNVSAHHFGTSIHGRVTLQELPGYVAKMLGFENKNALRAIKVPVGDNINVQCLYNDCGENIVRGSLREEDKIATMLPTPGDFAGQVMFEEGIDDPREEDPSIAAMLQANMSANLDLENIERIADDEALMEAIEEIFGQLPIELRDDDNTTVLCFFNECDGNYGQFSENEEVKNQTPPKVEDFADEVIFVEEIDDPREEDPVVSGMLRSNTPGSIEDYVGDSNRTPSAENQENIPEPVDHNAQPIKTLPVLDNKDLVELANCVCFEDGGTEAQASKHIHSLRSIELRDDYYRNVQSFDKDCEENIMCQCLEAGEDITNPPPTREDFNDEVIFVEETGDAQEEDPVVSGMLQKNTLANYGALIENDMDNNEKAEPNVQPMETPYTSVPKNSSHLRDSLKLDTCVRFEDGGTGAQTSEDIYSLRSIELRDGYNSYVQSFVKDCGENISYECLKAGEDMTIPPPTLEHFADKVMFVEEIDDPREENPVVSGMLQNNTLGSIDDEDYEADSNRTASAGNQKHVQQLVGHYTQPIISPCVPVLEKSCNSDGTSHRSMDSENFVILEKDRIRMLNIEDIYNLVTPDLCENGEINIQSFYKDCGENIVRQMFKDEEDITNMPATLEDFTDEVIFIEEVDNPREEDPVVSGMLRTNTPESIDELIEEYPGSNSNPKHSEENQDNCLQPLDHNITFLGMPLKIPSVPVLPNSGKSNGTSRRKQSLKPILQMNFG
uniref:Uncharacterized protein n=1 Tax=Anopheles atroparvus TaxID=41427 RepID=A0AAG5CYS8_ANOAO